MPSGSRLEHLTTAGWLECLLAMASLWERASQEKITSLPFCLSHLPVQIAWTCLPVRVPGTVPAVPQKASAYSNQGESVPVRLRHTVPLDYTIPAGQLGLVPHSYGGLAQLYRVSIVFLEALTALIILASYTVRVPAIYTMVATF